VNDRSHIDDAGTPEILPPNQCWALLRSRELGRLAFVLDGRVEVFPITYLVHGAAVVFRTSRGSKLSAVHTHSMVAFEVDAVGDGVAWSVIIRGRVREVTNMYDPVELARLPLRPHQGGPKDHVVVLEPGEITGRRFKVADRAGDRHSLSDGPKPN
jgi:uncharacterized protein